MVLEVAPQAAPERLVLGPGDARFDQAGGDPAPGLRGRRTDPGGLHDGLEEGCGFISHGLPGPVLARVRRSIGR